MANRVANHRRRLSVLIAAVGCGVMITACGSSGSLASAAATGKPNALKFANCMRSHGVSNFPDPSASGGINIGPNSGINPQSPSFQSAQQACGKLLGARGPGGPVSASEKRAAIANAQCMREHGVPNFPDPTFPNGGGILIRFQAGVDPQSPAFQAAQKACGGPGRGFRLRIHP